MGLSGACGPSAVLTAQNLVPVSEDDSGWDIPLCVLKTLQVLLEDDLKKKSIIMTLIHMIVFNSLIK